VAETHIKRRLAEVKTLKSEGQLNKVTAQIAKDALLSHADDVKENIALLVSLGKKDEVATASASIVATLTDFKKTELTTPTTVVAPVPAVATTDGTVSESVTTEATDATPTTQSLATESIPVSPVAISDAVPVIYATNDTKTLDDGILEITSAIDQTVSASAVVEDIKDQKPAPTEPEPVILPTDSVPVAPVSTPETVPVLPPVTPSADAKAFGSIHGSVSMVFSCSKDVEICPTPDPRVMVRKIVIADATGTVVARLTTGDSGDFVTVLPVGTYFLGIEVDEREVVSGIPETIVVKDHEASSVAIVLSVLIR
jgi:hypothetical protein